MENNLARYLFYAASCFILFCLPSCSGKLEKDAYVKWVQDQKNGLAVAKSVNGYVFNLQYQPTDYVLIQRHGQNINESNYREAFTEADQLQYYLLTIGIDGANTDFIAYETLSIQEKQEKIYYFSYLFQDDIYLEEEGEQYPCVLYHFERAMDLKNKRTFVLGFEKPASHSETSRLVINSERFDAGPIKLKISKKNIPSLKI